MTKNGNSLELSSTEFRVLLYLVERKVKVCSRAQLLDTAWKDEAFVEPRTADVHIQRLRTQIEDDPANPRPVYLIVDGIRLGVRAETTEKEAVLVAWAFLEDGSRELVSVSLGNRESYSAWKGFLEDLLKRGMSEPMLTVIDGCPGLIEAVNEVFSESDKQRCTKHRTENVLDKVLERDKKAVKESVRKVFYASTYEPKKQLRCSRNSGP